jgi:hypothetical protein
MILLTVYTARRSVKANHRSQRTPQFRTVSIFRRWRGAAAAERSQYRIVHVLVITQMSTGSGGSYVGGG